MIRRQHADAPGARLRRFATLAAVLGLSLVALGAPAQASAAAPCWKRLINDWYDGRIDNAYPVKCYREAIRNLPEDVKAYSSARDDINRALASAIRDAGGKVGPGYVVEPQQRAPRGDGGRQESPYLNEDDDDELGFPGRESSGGPLQGLFDELGPNSADAVPLPILILAGIAFLLLLAALASVITRRIQARRVTLATQPQERR